MWHAQLNRREFLELCLGGPSGIKGKLGLVSSIDLRELDSGIHVYWEHEAEWQYLPPVLAIVSEEDLYGLLRAVMSSPQAPSPLSAVTRLLTHEEALACFRTEPYSVETRAFPALVALAMAEAVLHTEGRVGLRQLTPALCKRTLTYAWGRALAARAPLDLFESLPERWSTAFSLISTHASLTAVHHTIGAAMAALSSVSRIAMGIPQEGAAGRMAEALMKSDEIAQERAWQELSAFLETAVTLKTLKEATREERAGLLQHALRISQANLRIDDSKSAACAFIATQVAPGSLEHLELLRHAADPSVLAWYAMYASLQAPKDILASQSGFGIRLLRDLTRVEDLAGRPNADIAFSELKMLERVGIDSVSKKFGHAGEVEVELLPFVTASFTYQARSARSSRPEQSSQLSFEMEPPVTTPAPMPTVSDIPPKAKISRLLSELALLVQELPEATPDVVQPKRTRRR